MASREHDIERGPETSQIATGMSSMQPPITPGPVRTYSTREPQYSSPPQQVQPLSRDFSLRYPSGMPSAMPPDNPILTAFRSHVGIYNDPSLVAAVQPQPQGVEAKSRSLGDVVSTLASSLATSNTVVPNGIGRSAPNIGIYQRVVAAERRYHKEYQMFAILINGALGLQIIFAAALTALGAGNGPHSAVTAFGALNTVLASLLTFLKGSGLPNRLKYYENEWSKVREYIEQRERDFSSDYHRDRAGWEQLAEEIGIIEHMYENVRKDIEANTPDSYVSMSNAMKTGGANISPGVARNLSRFAEKFSHAEEDTKGTGKDPESRIRSGISDFEHRISKGWNELEKQATAHVREIGDHVDHRARDASKQAESRALSVQQSMEDGLRRTQSNADTRIHDLQNTAQTHAQHAQNTGQSSVNDAQSKFNQAQSDLQSRYNQAQSSTLSSINETQDAAQARYNQSTADAQTRFTQAQTQALANIHETQNTAQSQLRQAQDSMQNTVHDAQTRFQNVEHDSLAKAREMEEKIAMVAEKAAEKVLQFSKHRHEH